MPGQTSSSSQPPAPTPANGPPGHSPENSGEHISNGVWKRRYHELQETLNNQNQSKKKKSNEKPSVRQLGRGIRKVIFLCGDIRDLVANSDKYDTYRSDPDDIDLEQELEGLDEDDAEDLKLSWKRCHTAVRELDKLIPGFQKKIDNGEPEELKTFYAQLEGGADGARGDDLARIRGCLAAWLNKKQPAPSPLLEPTCRENRGIAHDTTGRLLCPIDLEWDNLLHRNKIRAFDPEYDWLSSFHARCFYAGYKGDPEQLEQGFLKSILLVKVYMAIFTAPTSAENISEEDAENVRPARSLRGKGKKLRRCNVAVKVRLNNQVTPRSIAYAAVQLHFNLQDAESWSLVYGGFDYQGLYNYIVDFFEDVPGPDAKKRTKDLLNWWSDKVFGETCAPRQLNVSTSRKALKSQRAALESTAVARF